MLTDKKEEKFLGSSVHEDLYWEFKNVAARRKETMQDAITHAVRLYIDIDKEEERAKENG